jgi:hypothetical protein
MNTIEQVLVEIENNYRSGHQHRADSIDATVDHMRATQDTWGYTRPIVEWESVTNNVVAYAKDRDTSKATLEIAEHLLETGEWNGIRIDVDDIYRGMGGWKLSWPNNGTDLKNVREAYIRRLFYAHLAIDSLETFEAIQQNDIIGLHGTQAITLPSIIEAGALLSHADQHALSIPTGSGEAMSVDIRRGFISFGSIHDSTALHYSESDLRSERRMQDLKQASHLYEGYQLRVDEITAYNKQINELIDGGDGYIEYANTHRFGIVFGLGRKALWSAGIDERIGRGVEVDSDIDEVCFAHKVGLSYLQTLFVNEQHKEQVLRVVPKEVTILSKEVINRAQRDAYQSFRIV